MSAVRADVVGVVLAGGASRRFGSDKLAVEVGGRPLLDHAIERLLDVCPEVVVVLAPNGEEPQVPRGPVVFAHDEAEHQGPLAGLVGGLRGHTSERAVVVGGDMLDLQPSVLTALLRLAAVTGASAAALGEGDRFRPLPCVVSARIALETAEQLLAEGERSLRALLERLSVEVLAEEAWLRLDPDRRTLRDVDEPSDLADPG